jgi:hypothetical protein
MEQGGKGLIFALKFNVHFRNAGSRALIQDCIILGFSMGTRE